MTHTVYINAPLDYVMGHLRYGHLEGSVELDDEQFAAFKEDPLDAIEKYDLTEELRLEVDSWRIEDWGDIMRVDYVVLD